MVRIGDWIVVPSASADGIVIDITLNTVKIQNWDNTIVTLPPYNLIFLLYHRLYRSRSF